jgi:hypothetical protein
MPGHLGRDPPRGAGAPRSGLISKDEVTSVLIKADNFDTTRQFDTNTTRN